jgi:type I restriction enzyme M protein
MLSIEIKSKINRLWDMFWAGGMTNPITALEQISYLLFMRRVEDVNLVQEEKYKWSVYTKSIEYSSNLPIHMKEVFDHLKNIRSDEESFTIAMDGAHFEMNRSSLLSTAIELIDEIYLEVERERLNGQHFQDTLGDFYELILKQTSEAGKNGQFRTPRHIIQLMCEILDPKIEDEICDVTSGTSGFLVSAYQYIISQNSSETPQVDENGFSKRTSGDLIVKDSSDEKKLIYNTFYGYDIDKTMIRLGMMNLIMHNIKKPKIKYIDSLSQDFDDQELNNQYSIILANPPFTGRIDSLRVGKTLNRIYDLKPIIDKKTGKEKAPSAQSEILFLERIIQLLKVEGKAAVIIPEGVLFGSGKAQTKIREILLKDCCLDAVISLPVGSFLPYTGVKTSILVFTKKQLNSKVFNTKKVWFYGLESDGYSLDSNRKILKEKPLPLVVEAYHISKKAHYSDRKNKHFHVPIKDIKENNYFLSFNQYKSFVYDEESYQDPKILLSQLLDLEKEIFKGIDDLKIIL